MAKIMLSFMVEESTISKLDSLRGLAPRSAVVNRIVEKALDNPVLWEEPTRAL
jgi:hypothetical protein